VFVLTQAVCGNAETVPASVLGDDVDDGNALRRSERTRFDGRCAPDLEPVLVGDGVVA